MTSLGFPGLVHFTVAFVLRCCGQQVPPKHEESGAVPDHAETLFRSLMFMGPCIIFIVE